MPAAADPMLYTRAAAPVLAFAEGLAQERGAEAGKALRHAAELLDRFAAELLEGGAPRAAVPPARYALGLIIDQRARANRAIAVKAWAAGAHRMLFDGREMSLERLRDFARRARAAGPDYAGPGRFLEDCLARAEEERRRLDRPAASAWGASAAAGIAGFLVLVLSWTGYVEWRHHRDLNRVFAAERAAAGLDEAAPGTLAPEALAARLDRLAEAARRVAQSAQKAPVHILARPLGFDAEVRASAAYDAALTRHLPFALARAVDTALATEGEGVELYDTLRAWDVLSGQAAFSPAYLQGWLLDRPETLGPEAGLAPHVARLAGPAAGLPQPDPELVAQARGFASETPETERAWLELRRAEETAALPPWRVEAAVPGAAEVLVRRSGVPMATPLPGLFTQAGWDHARDFGAGLAVQKAREEARRMFSRDLDQRNDTPDRVMDRLQAEAIAHWQGYLADLRVRPFSDRAASVLISGRLAQRDSILGALLRAVWAEAGGLDRRRAHGHQISVATAFGPAIQYVEQGRMAEISGLFAALNVALGAMDVDEEAGLEGLMSVQDRAASVSALGQAPAVVVQIVEDVLAQTAAEHADMLTNPVTRRWQSEVLPLCQSVTEARFPFAEAAAEAPLADFAALFGPGGAMDRFFRSSAEPYLDTAFSPWRWKPEARFAGLSPDSAVFFQRALAISQGYFGADGRTGADLTLAALAERGRAVVALGGAAEPVEAAGAEVRLAWPGPAPEAGAEVAFQSPEGEARLAHAGEWGLVRLLDGTRLRERDGGRRFLLDLRAGGARLFLEMAFESGDNPVSRRALLRGFRCPAAL